MPTRWWTHCQSALGRVQSGAESSGRAGNDGGLLGGAAVAPARGGGLHVDHGDWPSLRRLDGKVHGDCALADPALLEITATTNMSKPLRVRVSTYMGSRLIAG
jgi:hypothetical protein